MSSENRLKIMAAEMNHWDKSRMNNQAKNSKALLINYSKISLAFHLDFISILQ